MTTTILKTPIVYYGGKTSMVGHLLDMVPEHDVYTEVFLGGATLFFAKRPARNETINDRLDMVVNFYRVLKRDFRKLKKMIDATLIGRAIHSEALNTINLHKRGITVDRINLAWAFWVCTNFALNSRRGRMDNGILTRTEVLVSNYKSACGTIELFNQPSPVPGAAPSL